MGEAKRTARRCDPKGVWKAAKGNLTLSHEYAVDIARDLEDAERELAAAKELAKWKPEGPCAEENRDAISVLLEIANQLAQHGARTIDITVVPTYSVVQTVLGRTHRRMVGKSFYLEGYIHGWTDGRPAPCTPLLPACRCGLTQGHEPTCPELDR